MIELTPADLPDALASMSTGAAVTRWRKKPVVIEAFQLTMDEVKTAVLDKVALPFGVKISSANYHPQNRTVSSFGCYIDTIEGRMRAVENDWIIRGEFGEVYPCKPHIFAATYEPESESTGAGITDAESVLEGLGQSNPQFQAHLVRRLGAVARAICENWNDLPVAVRDGANACGNAADILHKAVEARTRQATPDEVAEAVTVLKNLLDALNEEARLEIKHQDMLKNPASHTKEDIGASMRALENAMYDSLSAHHVASAFITTHTTQKTGGG